MKERTIQSNEQTAEINTNFRTNEINKYKLTNATREGERNKNKRTNKRTNKRRRNGIKIENGIKKQQQKT